MKKNFTENSAFCSKILRLIDLPLYLRVLPTEVAFFSVYINHAVLWTMIFKSKTITFNKVMCLWTLCVDPEHHA